MTHFNWLICESKTVNSITLTLIRSKIPICQRYLPRNKLNRKHVLGYQRANLANRQENRCKQIQTHQNDRGMVVQTLISKQLPLPSTAATSNMNQLMVINEHSNINGRLSGMQPGLDSSLLQSDISQKSYLQKFNKQNMADSSFQTNNGNYENTSNLINMTQFQDEFAPFQLDSTKHSNLNEDSQIFSSQFAEIKTGLSSGVSPDKKQKLTYKDQSQNQIQARDKQNVKLKKRRHQTEPNSPMDQSNDAQNTVNGSQNPNKAIIMNGQIVIGREMPIRMSGNKLNIVRNPQQQNGAVGQKTNKRKQQQQESLMKLNNSLEDQQSVADFFNAAHHRQEPPENLYSPQTDEKNSSFLPRLDVNHRYSNSQVQYREPSDFNRNDSKDKSDMSLRQNPNSWISESLNSSSKKNSYSVDRKNLQPQIQVNYTVNDFNQSGRGPHIKQPKRDKAKAQNYNTSTHLYSEISPQNNNLKEFSELYSLKNGIGKIQPVPEIKTQFNEQVIRGKIYRDKLLNSETPQKVDLTLISLGKSGNLPHSEIVSPSNVVGSPLNYQFEQNRPAQNDGNDSKMSKTRMLNVNNSLQIQQMSELSEDFNMLNDKIQNAQTQFQYRNYSISQGSSKQEAHERFHQQVPQFNTIEDVVRSSKDNLQLLKSGQINLLESSQSNNYPAYLEDPNLSLEKQSINSKVPVSLYSGAGIDNQMNASSLNLQKQFHHTIKTVASKQMPKCFRMSKHQLQIIQRQNFKNSGNSSHNSSNKMFVLDNIQNSQNKFDHTFVIMKQTQANQRSASNDARVSFSHENANNPQYQTIQRSKIDFQTPVRQSNKFSSNIFNEDNYPSHNRQSTDRLDIDKERMTPAFNARQSYNTRPV
ncbi:UNKNOWN [Stylonychia lemnae]|uniref:Uncharacterized protein n=1 Tax=Stylonychia lemnae TaxID=5949 RepID=A0A078B2A6_STYLE|nr:UNKNOWN [Stylonychia lemnae]|eukprot:CDW88619.1 UNKNOWN [Stylonychia lemnae]